MKPTLIKNRNGIVTRLQRCSCGTPIYKKDLTNDIYEIMTRNGGSQKTTSIKIENQGDGHVKFSCRECGESNIVFDFR